MVACNDYIILDTMIYRILQVRYGESERKSSMRANAVPFIIPIHSHHQIIPSLPPLDALPVPPRLRRPGRPVP